MLICKLISTILLIPNNVMAEQWGDYSILQPYINELSKINQEYGTELAIDSMGDSEEDKKAMIDYFSRMSIPEFKKLILAAVEDYMKSDTSFEKKYKCLYRYR